MNIHLLKRQNHHHNINMPTPSSTSSGHSLGIHKNSRNISKIQPKIRIIHLFAPEIIQTDVANFRELVQRLTGKPSSGKGKDKGKGKEVKKSCLPVVVETENDTTVSTKVEVMMGGVSGSSSSPASPLDICRQPEGWRSSSSFDHHINNISGVGGGYLTPFTDLDDSFDFGHVLQMGVNDISTHLNAFGE